MVCNLCKGYGNLFVAQRVRGFEWYCCPACDGRGDLFPQGPATIPARSGKETP